MYSKNRNTVLNVFKQVFALINKTTGCFFNHADTKRVISA